MKGFLSALKLFGLDWIILFLMYLAGSLITKLGISGCGDLIRYLNVYSPSPSTFVDVIIYFFISISLVILIAYLINKSYFKVATKLFLISQTSFVASVVLAIFMAIKL